MTDASLLVSFPLRSGMIPTLLTIAAMYACARRHARNRRISAARRTLRGTSRSSLPIARAGTPSWVRPPDDSADMPWTCRPLGSFPANFVLALEQARDYARWPTPKQRSLALSLSAASQDGRRQRTPSALADGSCLVLVNKDKPLSLDDDETRLSLRFSLGNPSPPRAQRRRARDEHRHDGPARLCPASSLSDRSLTPRNLSIH